ncbi:MAG: hypothetical protein NT067_05935 [Candidatus Diapherotrites archaeon]|nr:hypothetical protein [Candidatus Diapherotrites archaeon]
MPQAGETKPIGQVILLVHPLFTYWSMQTGINDRRNLGLEPKKGVMRLLSERYALKKIVSEMNSVVDRMARKRKTNVLFVVVKTECEPRTPVERAQNAFLNHCRKRFDNLAELPSETGLDHNGEATRQILSEIATSLSRFHFSEKLSILHYGEYEHGCVATANGRIVKVLKERFRVNVPAKRQHSIRKLTSYGDADAIDALYAKMPLQKRRRVKSVPRPMERLRWSRRIKG